MMEENDFYIGWQENSPKDYSKLRSLFFMMSLLVTIAFIAIFIPSQNQFPDSVFEFGEFTELTGTLVDYPVYGLRTTFKGKSQTVPLIGFGKKGPHAVIDKLVDKFDGPINNYKVTLRGTIIRYQDKAWMELTEEDASIVLFEKSKVNQLKSSSPMALGQVKLTGEIVDPKCFFGVMKPAYGKIHKSCAIRCISGGIPPVLAIKENDEYVDYYFLLDELGKHPGLTMYNQVGKIINVEGIGEQIADWKVMKTSQENIEVISNLNMLDEDIRDCNSLTSEIALALN